MLDESTYKELGLPPDQNAGEELTAKIDLELMAAKMEQIKKGISISGDLSVKDGLLLLLSRMTGGIKKKSHQTELKGIIEYLHKHIKQIYSVEPAKKEEAVNYRITYTLTVYKGEEKGEVEKKVSDMFANNYVQTALADLTGTRDQYLAFIKKLEDLERREKALKKKEEKLREKNRPRMSKHMTHNLLMKKKTSGAALTLWDQLNIKTKDSIKKEEIELVNLKGEGIQLSTDEERLLICLNEMLEEKTREAPQAIEKTTSRRGTTEKEVSPRFVATNYEVAKKFTNSSNPGGVNIRRINEMLMSLAHDREKKCLLRYTKTVYPDKGLNGSIRKIEIEEFVPLVHIKDIKDTIQGETASTQRERTIFLNPIFVEQIARHYINYPRLEDIYKAYGSSNLPRIIQRLPMELGRALSSPQILQETADGQKYYIIGEDKLFESIAPDYMPPNKKRPKVIQEKLAEGCRVAIELGIIEKWDIVRGKIGNNYRFFFPRRGGKKVRSLVSKTPKKNVP